MKYYSIGEFADKIGKTIQTLRNWDKNNTFKPAYVTTGGTRYYSQEQLNNFLGLKIKTKINKKIVGYCRVSSTKQKDDLERQIENVRTYMIAKGYQFEIITDIGSGINYNKKGLNQLIDMITQTSHTENIPYALINQLELNVESHSRTLLCTQTTHPKSGQIVQESFQERFDQQDF